MSGAGPDDMGTRREYSYLRICRSCSYLYEEGRPDGLEQRCRCRPGREARWPGFDYNRRASLCLCCAVVALPSGSRPSPYFCNECQARAKDLSLRAGRLIFPIGPHSLMHTWVPTTLGASDGDAGTLADGLYRTGVAIQGGFAVLEKWYGRLVPWRLQQLGLDRDVSLHDYIAAAGQQGWDAPESKAAAFEWLCLYAETGTVGVSLS